jgi:hypothetical protein
MPWVFTIIIVLYHLVLKFLVQQILCSERFHNEPGYTEAASDCSGNRDAFVIAMPSNIHAHLSLSKAC